MNNLSPKVELPEDWKKVVKRWYQGYSSEEKLLVLHTQQGMIQYIESLLDHARQDERKKVVEKIVLMLINKPTGYLDESRFNLIEKLNNDITSLLSEGK